MAKIITSKVARFPGTVELSDPLSFPQVIEIEKALGVTGEKKPTVGELQVAALPAVFACVEKWDLSGSFPQNPTPGNFPPTPRQASMELFIQLWGAVLELYNAEDTDIPNA